MMGSDIGRAAQRLLLARAMPGRSDQVETGLDAPDEALAWIEAIRVRGSDEEVHRFKGELLLLGRSSHEEVPQSTTEAAAEACFRRAIAVARQQEAQWRELRATISLCRLLKERNTPQNTDCAEALQTLAEIYGRFTEGFEMSDMREARALLQEVSQGQLVAAGS